MKTQKHPLRIRTVLAFPLLGLLILTAAASSHVRPALGLASQPRALSATLTTATDDRTVVLTVQVIDTDGKPVSNARVSVYRGFWNTLITTLPADYREDTAANGIARIPIVVKTGEKLAFSIWVSREDLQSDSKRLNFGTEFPTRLPLQTFILKPKKGTEENSVTFSIKVTDDKGNPVEGAKVRLTNSGWGPEHSWWGVTGPKGSVTVSGRSGLDPQYKGNASERWSIQASKQGYKDGGLVGGITTGIKEIGTTVDADTITLQRTSESEVVVTVTVTDEQKQSAVSGATVSLEGSISSDSATTNASGKATLRVAGTGDYKVSISHDKYYARGDSIRVLKDETSKAAEFTLKVKESADAGNDTLEVTVLGRDTTDETSQPAPVPGAKVTDGRTTATTDGAGHATLKGVFDGEYKVTAIADSYNSKTRVVVVHGDGSAKLTLEPKLSENSPLRLIVKVLDPNGNGINHAGVEFFTTGRRLYGNYTNASGETAFESKLVSQVVPLSELRRGLTINVTATGYQTVGFRAIPVEYLQPSLTASTYPVVLDKDWSELTNKVADLWARASAWRSDMEADRTQFNTKEGAIIEKALIARKEAEELLNDQIKAAKDAFSEAAGPNANTVIRDLKQEIDDSQRQANSDLNDLELALADATNDAAHCSTPADAEAIRSNYRTAIQLLGDIGKLNNDAAIDQKGLSRLAELSLALKNAEQDIVLQIGAKADLAQQAADEIEAFYASAAPRRNTLFSRQTALKAELAVLTVKYETTLSGVPADQRTQELSDIGPRLNSIGFMLNSVEGLYSPPARTPAKSITWAVTEISNLKREAAKLAEQDAVYYHVDTKDEAVNGIADTLNSATFDVALAADLLQKADSCAKAAAPSNTDNKGGQGVEPLPEDKKPAAGATNNPADNNGPANNNAPANSASASNNAPAPTMPAPETPTPSTTTATPANSSSGASSGLCEPQDVAQRVEALIDDAINVTSFVAADLYLAQARALAAPYPCMTARVDRAEGAIAMARDSMYAPQARKTSTGLPNENGPYVDVPNPSNSPTVEGLPEDNPSPIPNNLGPGMRLGAVVTAGGASVPTVESIPEDLPKGRTSPASNNPPPTVEPTPEDNPQGQPVASGDPGPSGASGNAQKKPTDPNAPSPWEKIGAAIGTAIGGIRTQPQSRGGGSNRSGGNRNPNPQGGTNTPSAQTIDLSGNWEVANIAPPDAPCRVWVRMTIQSAGEGTWTGPETVGNNCRADDMAGAMISQMFQGMQGTVTVVSTYPGRLRWTLKTNTGQSNSAAGSYDKTEIDLNVNGETIRFLKK